MTSNHSHLTPLDSFPYRNKLFDVMARPAVTATPDKSVADACKTMGHLGISSVLIVDTEGKLAGIVTHGDVIGLLAKLGAAALALTVGDVMNAPVHSVRGEDYLYVAIGMVTARGLLKLRADQALIIGDDLSQARTVQDLARARGLLPGLAAALRRDGTPARLVAGVISGVVRDITGRAAEMVEAQLEADGWGAAPAPYALLVLGSAGRGESLLAFDQDNAVVHRGPDSTDSWFGEFGTRLNTLLDEAGIPLCKGGVMAGNPAWRLSLKGWEEEIRRWVFQPQEQTLLNVDIFFDMEFAYGDRALARELKAAAFAIAGQSGFFLQRLSQNVTRIASPFGVFGRLTTEAGRLDVKKFGLLPLVSTARIKALQAGIADAATSNRLCGLAAQGKLHEDDLNGLLMAQEVFLTTILDQQITDIESISTPSTRVAPASLSKAQRARLKRAFERVGLLKTLAQSLMSV